MVLRRQGRGAVHRRRLSEIEQAGFNPADAVDFWDRINRQDWVICENDQRGMQSRVFQHGY